MNFSAKIVTPTDCCSTPGKHLIPSYMSAFTKQVKSKRSCFGIVTRLFQLRLELRGEKARDMTDCVSKLVLKGVCRKELDDLWDLLRSFLDLKPDSFVCSLLSSRFLWAHIDAKMRSISVLVTCLITQPCSRTDWAEAVFVTSPASRHIFCSFADLSVVRLSGSPKLAQIWKSLWSDSVWGSKTWPLSFSWLIASCCETVFSFDVWCSTSM